MTSMFGHFLQYLYEIDTGKEIPPRVDGNDFSLFTVYRY